MLKKMFALSLICAILVPFSSVAAAGETPESRTMEEILNEYHRRAFEAQVQGNAGTGSPNSRSGGKTLEEETVDALTAAGYEAYHVTAASYETLQTQLKTDFSDMGLDPSVSYFIIVGEQPVAPEGNANSRSYDPPVQENFGDGSSGSTFEYTHEGTTFLMRYLTIIPTLQNGMIEERVYTVQPDMFWENTIQEIVTTSLVSIAETAAEEATGKAVPIGLIFSILEDLYTDENLHEIEPGTITILADSTWNCHLIQIWCASTNSWDTAQCSEYVRSKAYLTRIVVDASTGQTDRIMSDAYSNVHYSPKYFNFSQRIDDAIDHYDRVHSSIALDYVNAIDFYFRSADGEILYVSDGNPLFTIERDYSFPRHSFE